MRLFHSFEATSSDVRPPHQLLGIFTNCETASPFFCYTIDCTLLCLAAILKGPHCSSDGSGGVPPVPLCFFMSGKIKVPLLLKKSKIFFSSILKLRKSKGSYLYDLWPRKRYRAIFSRFTNVSLLSLIFQKPRPSLNKTKISPSHLIPYIHEHKKTITIISQGTFYISTTPYCPLSESLH